MLGTLEGGLCYPFVSFRAFVDRVSNAFEASFLRYTIVVYCFVIGFFKNAVDFTLLPVAQTLLGVSAVESQRVLTCLLLPRMMGPMFALFSDNKPFFGYHKRPYLIVAGGLGGLTSAALATESFAGKEKEWEFVSFAMLGLAAMNIYESLLDGKRTELMHENPSSGSDLIAFSMGFNVLGHVIALVIGYFAVKQKNYTSVFYVGIAAFIGATAAAAMGELPEKKVKYWWNLNATGLMVKRNQFILAGLLMIVGMFLVCMQAIEVTSDEILQFSFLVNLMLGICIVALCKLLLPKVAGNVVVYAFFERALQIRFQQAVNYWYTLPRSCVPNGPHFDYMYFSITNGFVSLLFNGLGVWLFQEAFRSGGLRRAFWWSSGTRCFGSLVDLLVVTQKNKDLGIPDEIAYVVGNSCLEAMMYALAVMPFAVLIAKLVVSGTETTLVAILNSASSIGALMASSIGALAIEYAGIRTNIEDPMQKCDWNNLEWLITACGILSPLLCVPLTFVLIPNVSVTAVFEVDDSTGEIIAVHEDNDRTISDKGK